MYASLALLEVLQPTSIATAGCRTAKGVYTEGVHTEGVYTKGIYTEGVYTEKNPQAVCLLPAVYSKERHELKCEH